MGDENMDLRDYDTGMIDFKTKRHENAAMRFLKFNRWLVSTIGDNGIKELYYEEVRRHRGVQAAHVFGSFQTIVQTVCEVTNVAYQSVPVQTIKKHATTLGNASKTAMIQVAQHYKPEIADDNEADAFWLLDYALYKIRVDPLT